MQGTHAGKGNRQGIAEATEGKILYNMQDLKPYKVRTYLPHARIYLDVPCHDAAAMIRDLLTDPRITDDDYLFFEDDPTAPPPSPPRMDDTRGHQYGIVL